MPNRLFKSFGYAFEGVQSLFKSTPNARIHLAAAFFATVLGFWLNLSTTEWAIIILCIGFVISAETFNTALETLTDLVSPEIHPFAKKTKDLAAGAVLISAMTALLVGIIIFFPKLVAFLNG